MTAVPFFDTRIQHRKLRDELAAALQQLITEGHFVGAAEIAGFENEFARYLRVAHVIGVASGTDAIRIGLLAMGIGPGHRVVTVSNTYAATVAAIIQTGARVDFVDVDHDTLLMDLEALEGKLRAEWGSAKLLPIRAVVPVHLFGSCVDMSRLESLSTEFAFATCEDACQAHGAELHGRKAGSFGTCAAFSFYPSKNLGGLGDGGALVTNDAELGLRARRLRNHGQSERNVHIDVGWNSRLDALQAEFLRIKLPYLDAWNAARRGVAQTYDTAFDGAPGLLRVSVPPHCHSGRHLYVVRCSHRAAVIAACQARGVETAIHYPTPVHLQQGYQVLGFGKDTFPVAEQAARDIVSLPLFPEMEPYQVDMVIDAVRCGAAAV